MVIAADKLTVREIKRGQRELCAALLRSLDHRQPIKHRSPEQDQGNPARP